MSSRTSAPSRILLAAAPAVVVAAGLGALLSSGAAQPGVLGDPGALARWGGPVVSAATHLGAAIVLGGLTLLLFVLPYGRTERTPAWRRAAAIVAGAAPVWAVLHLLDVLLRYASAAGRPFGGAGFGTELWYYLTEISAGRMALIATVLIATAAVAAAAVTSYRTAVIALLPAFAVLLPWSTRGHASSATDHALAVSSMWLHLLGAAVWIGGLAVLAMVLSPLGRDAVPAVRRYSGLALVCFVIVGISGLASGWLRLGSPADLAGPWGRLLVTKVVLFAALGVFGWWHRRRTLPHLATGSPGRRRALFARVAGVEVLVMVAVTAVASALAVTAPPVPQDEPHDAPAAVHMTGAPIPPEPAGIAWLTQVSPDLVFALALPALAGLYLAGVVRLRRRGVHWPIWRAVFFVSAVALLAWTVLGGVAVYGKLLFSAHMIGHMTMAMVVPIGLVLGAPVTLALRALTPRKDGSRGPREWLLVAVRSRVAHFLGHPVVAAVNFGGSMVVFYFTGLFEFALTNHLGHVLMVVHFVLVGYLFVNALIGVDPGPPRPSHALRLVLLFATMAFHAFFGVALMQMNTLLAPDYFGALGLPWGVDALADQRSGAAITWGLGEIPAISIAIAVALAWYRDDTREATRKDRAADRDGDAELHAYNRMLQGLNQRDG